MRNSHGKVWLNVGSGARLLPGFVNLDSDWLVFLAPFYGALKPLLKHGAREWIETFRERRKTAKFRYTNCSKPLRVEPESVDHILASHFLEHLYREDAVRVVDAFFAALKPGGTLHVIVPDIEEETRNYLARVDEPNAADDLVKLMMFTSAKKPMLPLRLLYAFGLFGPMHKWMYDRRSMVKLLESAGFRMLEKNDTPSAEWLAHQREQVNVVAVKPPKNL